MNPSNTLAIIVEKEQTFIGLLTSGYSSARTRNSKLVVILLGFAELPIWANLPNEISSENIDLIPVPGPGEIKTALKILVRYQPYLIGMAIDTKENDARYLAGSKLEILVRQAACPIYFLKSTTGWVFPEKLTCFVPFWDDENTKFAIKNALEFSPNLKITAGIVVPPTTAQIDCQIQEEELKNHISTWKGIPPLYTKVLTSADEEQALLAEAEDYDFLLVGASRGNWLTRTLFGDARNRMVTRAKGPAIILRENQGKTGATLAKGWNIFDQLLPSLNKKERIEAYRGIRRGGRPSRDFYSMIALSASIASLGLILNSSAVIIGAMLVAPLMSAIVGMGMAIIHGDHRFLGRTTTATLKGAGIAVATGFLFGLFNFHGDPTQEILARTAPSVLDLIVALISGIAAAYALCRKNVSNSLPGVAIAVALVPPLATVGTCLSIGYWVLAFGALKLFLSNMVAIVFASSLVFASFGFRPNIDSTQHKRHKVFQRTFIGSACLVVLMLGLLAIRITGGLHEAYIEDEVEQEINKYLKNISLPASVAQWSLNSSKSDTLQITLLLKTDRNIQQTEADELSKIIAEEIKQPISLKIEQFPVTRLQSKSAQ